MDETIKKAAKVLAEMAVAKMPQGVKRKRHPDYSGVHDIHVDGEHVATISGDKARYRGAPSHAKEYKILAPGNHSEHTWHKDTQSYSTNEHPDHHTIKTETHYKYGNNRATTTEKRQVIHPEKHDSMDGAIESIVHTHRNNKEFGHGHDPKKRWELAAASSHGMSDHNKKTQQYHAAIHAAAGLGHQDVVDALSSHHDAYKASVAGQHLSKERVHQLTHDARGYTATEHNSNTRNYEPKHPEHHAAATAAVEARQKHGLY